MKADHILDKLLYRDAMMLILNKPAGIPVHKGRGGGENLEQYFDDLRFGLPRLPALAHRLDKDTSGCLVLGRHRKALQRLGKLFEQGKVEKTYWAIVHGTPAQQKGMIELPLAKASPDPRNWTMTVSDIGQPAQTEFTLLGTGNGLSWLELKPRTGRTHQLRVHCAAMEFPIVGDRLYGKPEDTLALHLHAESIRIPLYPKKDAICASAPPPEHMLGLLHGCGYIFPCES